MCSTLAERGITLHLSGIKLSVDTALRRAGAQHEGPLLQIYRTDAEALAALRRLDTLTSSSAQAVPRREPFAP